MITAFSSNPVSPLPPPGPRPGDGCGPPSADGSGSESGQTVRATVRRRARPRDAGGPSPLGLMKMLGRLRWIALAWCACSAALGVYVAAGGLGWLTGAAALKHRVSDSGFEGLKVADQLNRGNNR